MPGVSASRAASFVRCFFLAGLCAVAAAAAAGPPSSKSEQSSLAQPPAAAVAAAAAASPAALLPRAMPWCSSFFCLCWLLGLPLLLPVAAGAAASLLAAADLRRGAAEDGCAGWLRTCSTAGCGRCHAEAAGRRQIKGGLSPAVNMAHVSLTGGPNQCRWLCKAPVLHTWPATHCGPSSTCQTSHLPCPGSRARSGAGAANWKALSSTDCRSLGAPADDGAASPAGGGSDCCTCGGAAPEGAEQ